MSTQTIQFPHADTLKRLALSDSGFVFDPVTGDSYSVNESGLAILRRLQMTAELAQVVDALQADFEVSALDAERDVIEFAGLLRNSFE